MYVPDSIQCISFGRTKPLELGHGGCILTDNKELYERASRMRYDGREIFKYTPWDSQIEFEVDDLTTVIEILNNQQKAQRK
jgi:dTDP-4-amino-4,6-dideoxygalactose transaminase